MVPHLRRVAGFAALPAFSLLASVVLLPLVAARFGPGGWVTLGTGQATGAVVAILCGLSWATTGGHDVALADPAERRRLVTRSLATRSLALAVALPAATAVVVLVDAAYPLAAWLFMLGTALNTYTMAWFYAGTATPRHLAVNEGLVRLVGYAAASLVLLAGGALWLYALITVVGGLTSLALNLRTIRRLTAPHAALPRADHLATLRVQVRGTLGRTGFALFTFGGPALFALGATAAVAEFNAVDQMLKASVSATSILPQAFVAVVAVRAVAAGGVAGGVAGEVAWWRRPESLVVLWLPVAALLVWASAGPMVARYLFAGELRLSGTCAALIGLALAATMSVRSYELLVAVPLGLAPAVFAINAVVSLLGVGLLYAAARADSVTAGLLAWIAVHGVVHLCGIATVRRHRYRYPHESASEIRTEVTVSGGLEARR